MSKGPWPPRIPVRDWTGQEAYLRAMVADVRPDDASCWVWPFKLSTSGYGYIKWGKAQAAVHRVAYELAHGNEPNICRHACDRPECFNPNHLLDGTTADNAQDLRVRGTSSHGAAGRAKLEELQARLDQVERVLSAHGLTGSMNAPDGSTEES